jgi:hypothetical protein
MGMLLTRESDYALYPGVVAPALVKADGTRVLGMGAVHQLPDRAGRLYRYRAPVSITSRVTARLQWLQPCSKFETRALDWDPF